MEVKKNINAVTLMLTAVAGYCDTVTFVAGDNIFSAHVTGNFITFAYQMAIGGSSGAWIKLITFPVFIIAVIVGGWMASKSQRKNTVLFTEAILLIIAGLLAFIFHLQQDQKLIMYTIVMIVVFALGLQNAFGKLFSKETHGPTTMMTGNVTQASLDLGKLLFSKLQGEDTLISFKKQMVTVSGFLLGCVTGAFAGREIGLSSIIFAGAAMLICYFISDKKQSVITSEI